MTTDAPAFAHKTYRCEWLARVAMVDQYGRSVPREEPEYEQAWPTRELAQADMERVTTAHPVLGRVGKTVYSIGAVAYREVPVEQVEPEITSGLGM